LVLGSSNKKLIPFLLEELIFTNKKNKNKLKTLNIIYIANVPMEASSIT